MKITINAEKSLPINNGDALLVLATVNQNHLSNFYNMHPILYQSEEMTTVILAPMYGGIWTLCISLTGIIFIFILHITVYNKVYLHLYVFSVYACIIKYNELNENSASK